MKVIDQLLVPRIRGTQDAAAIQLLAGDLAALPVEHAVDALVVSAFPDSYTPNEGTLFESLYRRGLDMREVAQRKQEDERRRLGCWLSEPLNPDIAQTFHFTRIICFEPQYPEFAKSSGINEANIEEAVGFVFRCLNHFIIPDGSDSRRFAISSLAMPLLATGNQGVSVEAMLPRLLEAAVFWLEEGLPVGQLKIVAFDPEDVAVARKVFEDAKAHYHRRAAEREDLSMGTPVGTDWERELVQTLSREVIQTCKQHLREDLAAVALDDERALLQRLFERMDRGLPQRAGSSPADGGLSAQDYDVFVSYAHKQGLEVKEFVDALQQTVPCPRIFFDRTSIPAGGQWIKMLSDAVQKARTFIAVLSPDYTASSVCWDEFQCAKLKEYNTRQSVIKTVRLYSETNLPPIVGIYSYIDCAEGDLQKLRDSATAIFRAPGTQAES